MIHPTWGRKFPADDEHVVSNPQDPLARWLWEPLTRTMDWHPPIDDDGRALADFAARTGGGRRK